MKKKDKIILSLIFVSFFGLIEVKSQDNYLLKKPNVLLIITDQFTANALSCVGNTLVKTPALDKLAATGVRFEKNYVSQPLCLPFRSSLQTGRYPHEIGATSNQKKIEGTFPMLGNLMATVGYKTDYYGKWHVGTTPEIAGYKNYNNAGTDDRKADAAISYLQLNHKSPFFLTVSFMNPHNICELARADADGSELPDGSIGVPPSDLDKLPPLPLNFAVAENEPTLIRTEQNGSNFEYPTADWDEITWRQYLWGYYRLIEKVDTEIGRLLDALHKSDYNDNTVVIFTSDHGEGLAMHHWNQKKVFYDQVSRVPLIINWKGKSKNLINSDLVSNALDIPVTILDIAGVKKPKLMHGFSLLPIIEGKKPKPREFVVSETTFNEKSPGQEATGRMIRTKKYKYCVYNDGKNREQLFDMENDSSETNNLVYNKEFKEVLITHRKLILNWAKGTNDLNFPYYNP